MSSTLEVDEVVHRIAAAVKSTVNYQIFSIFQLDERTGLLQTKIVIRSNEREIPKLTVPLGKGLVGTAALLNESVRVGDVSLGCTLHFDSPRNTIRTRQSRWPTRDASSA